jgi:hypothetical protein
MEKGDLDKQNLDSNLSKIDASQDVQFTALDVEREEVDFSNVAFTKNAA